MEERSRGATSWRSATAIGRYEDHEDTREVMSGLLSRSGLMLDQARDASGALALAERAEYDLLLIDIGLPGMYGLELLRKLCRDRNVPSIAITAYAYPKDVQSCLEAGFDRCQVKPVGFDKLLAAIEEVCGKGEEGTTGAVTAR